MNNIKSIMLDTSFCIRLMDSNDALHTNALDYFRHFLKEKIILHISTIAIAEYSVGDKASNLPLDKLQIESFDFRDAEKAGELHKALINLKGSIPSYNRNIIANDVKMLAQITVRQIEAIITKDVDSLRKYVTPLIKAGNINLTFIDLNIPLNEALGVLF